MRAELRPERAAIHAFLLIATLTLATTASAAEPDYSAWTEILSTHYNPAKGMDYERLRREDYPKLTKLVDTLSSVDVGSLTRDEQLAYWMNLYNVSTITLIVDNYPVDSIRDLSKSLINKYQVFDREVVPSGGRMVSLNEIEHEKIREGFSDPRIHFAINCAARSCPPMRQEAFVGARVDAQLEEQARSFINHNVRVELEGDKATLEVTKIMDWFEEDFEKAGGVAAFVKKYLTGDDAVKLSTAKRIRVDHFDYDWTLNDWKH